MKMLRNKKGFSYILTCVLVLAVVMIIAVSVQYSLVFSLVRSEKEASRLALDSLVTKYAVEQYDALKQGEAYASHIDRTQLVRRAYGTLGFADAGITEKTVSKGDASYTVSRPEITAADSGSIGVTVRYTMTVPFCTFGRVVAEIPIPVEINAVLNEKY